VRRALITRAGSLAYPPEVWASLGAEMTDTLLDSSAGSRRRFTREIADLVQLGLRTRAARTAGAGATRLIADGFCLAAVWLMTLDLSTLLAQRARGMQDPMLAWPSIVLLGAVLALALVGYGRVAGAGALVWTALRIPALWEHHPGIGYLAPELLPVVCFLVLLLAPRQRAVDPRGLAWLIVPATLVATLGPSDGDQSPLLLAIVALASVLVVLFALAMLTTDPRVAIAGAVALSNLGIAVVAVNHDTSVVARLMVAAAPAVLAIAVTRTRRLSRSGSPTGRSQPGP
jgi:hypothetical protein